MFPSSPRNRKGVKVIPIGAVSQIVLCADDPDFIVLEAFNLLFSTTTIELPKEAPIGKIFKFALIGNINANPALTTHYVNILTPIPLGQGSVNYWRLFCGQRPVFTFGTVGWVLDVASSNNYSLAIGSHANGSSNGLAIGYNTSGYYSGVVIGHNADGSGSGVAVGYGANGNTCGAVVGGGSADGSYNGVAVGYQANGSGNGVAVGWNATGNGNGGVAVGYGASANGNNRAVAIGYYSKAQRYREFVKSADGATICLQSFSILDWYGDTANATPAEIFLGTTNQRALVLATSAYMFKLLAVARDNVNNVVSAWELTGAIKRDASNNTAIVGGVTKTMIGQDAAASAWDIAVTADDTNEALKITVTGAATTIRWNVRGDISELRF